MKFQLSKLKPYAPYAGILVLTAAVVWAANNYLTARTAEVEEKLFDKATLTKIKVVVPVRPLKKGEFLDLSALAIREVPKEYVNFDALTENSVAEYAGKKLIRDVSQGTPLLSAFIARYEFTPFSSTINPGERALTIPVDEINSVSGMLTAGDKVDLLVLMQKNSSQSVTGSSDMELFPLLEGVTVQATGTFTQNELEAQTESANRSSNVNRALGSYSTITISVPPRDAQKLVLAQQTGRIVALMRNPGDASLHGQSLSSSDVFGVEKAPISNRGNVVSYIVGGNFTSGSQGEQATSGLGAPIGMGNNEIISRLLRAAQTEQ